VLTSASIAHAVRVAIPRAADSLRPDVLAALATAATRERSPRGRAVLAQLLENARIAEADHVPLCQDTGTVWVRVELGADECVTGDLQGAIDAAVADAYRDAKLRMSVARDALLDRANTGDNTPAFVDIALGVRAGRGATVHVMLKGGGSDNASCVEMLPPGAGVEGVVRVVLQTVEAKATGACPPLLVGVGVGTTFDKVGGLAKKALLRPVGSPPSDPRLADLEAELLAAINATGIGPAGLGGDTTALAVHVATAPCHIAALPVAVNLGCSAVRSASVEVPA
jgi:tartrate/fumarate subfamily iron-sulfur-dependent hydro-lyase alpha chain